MQTQMLPKGNAATVPSASRRRLLLFFLSSSIIVLVVVVVVVVVFVTIAAVAIIDRAMHIHIGFLYRKQIRKI